MPFDSDLLQQLRDAPQATMWMWQGTSGVQLRTEAQMLEDINDLADGAMVYRVERKHIDTVDVPTKVAKDD